MEDEGEEGCCGGEREREDARGQERGLSEGSSLNATKSAEDNRLAQADPVESRHSRGPWDSIERRTTGKTATPKPAAIILPADVIACKLRPG